MSESVTPRLIKQLPVVHMSEDIIKIDIHDIVPEWDSYVVCLDIDKPGKKITKVDLSCAV
jgi:hypothetical protein